MFSKKNAGVAKRAEGDYEERVEEEDVLEKSRQATLHCLLMIKFLNIIK